MASVWHRLAHLWNLREGVGIGSVRPEDTGLAPDDMGIGSVRPEDTGRSGEAAIDG